MKRSKIKNTPITRIWSRILPHLCTIDNFVRRNRFHIGFIAVVGIAIIARDCSRFSSPIIKVSATTIDYYWDIFINIGISYISAVIFYIVVVYIPENKRRYALNEKIKLSFIRTRNNLELFLSITFEAMNVAFSETEGESVSQIFLVSLKGKDPFPILSQSIKKYDGVIVTEKHGTSRYNLLVKIANEIIKQRRELIKLIPYLSQSELMLYSELEDILIFDRMGDLKNLPASDHHFYAAFDEIITLIRKLDSHLENRTFRYIAEYEPD